ncbi:WecB/TagA/CpsF family glycosyltransferase [Rhodococcus sp. DMU1]|uniref:WecB/TagA/CpsF family glycosyltransferase n=1 Tax=Rhodococcus sp. DMU1 TaxID=2722825 RepID=UPI0024A704BB|nr:WecB/TagA/CpsF family glycosyltransferase [Rhodococcus sp. DMU1]
MLRSGTDSVSIRIRGEQIPFARRTLQDVVEEITQSDSDVWRVVITPNLHHIYLLRQDKSLVGLYASADLLLPDGWPVAWMLSRASGMGVDRIAGSDLLEVILETGGEGRPLVLVGGEDRDALVAVADRARRSSWKVFEEPAPRSEVDDPRSRKALVARVASSGSGGLVVLGLGAPKQERIAHEIRGEGGAGQILCLGMAINFSAGRIRRSPVWMQRAGMEWAHRIITEPRRLLPRYARDATAFIPTFVENGGLKK